MTPHALRARDYLGHMLGAVSQIEEYVRGRTRNEFLSTKLLQDAIIRNIEILGEASRNLLEAVPDIAARFPKIPFAPIYAMRNQLSHGYFAVDQEVVWKVIERDIPALRSELEQAIAAMDQQPPAPYSNS
jgi:uncharacterized protein with HEPN domain